MFRAEVDKRKRKKQITKAKAALDSDLDTFHRLQESALFDNDSDSDVMVTSVDAGPGDQIHQSGTQMTFILPSAQLPQDQQIQQEQMQQQMPPLQQLQPQVLLQGPESSFSMTPNVMSLLKKAKDDDLDVFLKFLACRQRAEITLLEKQAALRMNEIDADFRAKAQMQQAEADLRLAHELKIQEGELRKHEEEVKIRELALRQREADNDAKRLELQVIQSRAMQANMSNGHAQ